MTIKVAIADDHAIVISGITAVLEKAGGIIVAGEASDGRQLLELARKKPADVYVLDVAMPRLNGLDAAAQLLASDKKAKIIILSMLDDLSTVQKALRSGVKGYLVKESAPEEIVQAVHAVYSGRAYLTPVVSAALAELQRQSGRKKPAKSPVDSLTIRERAVIQLIAEGHSNKEIAAHLKVSANTVHTHRNNIARKLDIHKQTDLVRFAIREKIAKI